jgi:hypothetical protein
MASFEELTLEWKVLASGFVGAIHPDVRRGLHTPPTSAEQLTRLKAAVELEQESKWWIPGFSSTGTTMPIPASSLLCSWLGSELPAT